MVQAPAKKIAAATPVKKVVKPPPLKMLKKAHEMSVQDDGWANLGAVGSALRQIDPAFDPRAWGCTRLLQLIEAASATFEIGRSDNSATAGTYMRLREGK